MKEGVRILHDHVAGLAASDVQAIESLSHVDSHKQAEAEVEEGVVGEGGSAMERII